MSHINPYTGMYMPDLRCRRCKNTELIGDYHGTLTCTRCGAVNFTEAVPNDDDLTMAMQEMNMAPIPGSDAEMMRIAEEYSRQEQAREQAMWNSAPLTDLVEQMRLEKPSQRRPKLYRR